MESFSFNFIYASKPLLCEAIGCRTDKLLCFYTDLAFELSVFELLYSGFSCLREHGLRPCERLHMHNFKCLCRHLSGEQAGVKDHRTRHVSAVKGFVHIRIIKLMVYYITHFYRYRRSFLNIVKSISLKNGYIFTVSVEFAVKVGKPGCTSDHGQTERFF